MTTYNETAPAVNNPVALPRRISAESIARSRRQAQKRANLAAVWLSGRKPTVAQASQIFNVSIPLIRAALKRNERH